jgi:hypothetical protein
MLTRSSPTGWQHWLDVRLRHAPASRHTDPLRALDDMEDGLTQPLVEITEQSANGDVIARVSVFSDGEEPGPTEIAALEGLVVELRFTDSSR